MDDDADIRALCGRGEASAAAGLVIERFGPEVFGFLLTVLRSDQDAADVFSMFSEDVWRGLDRFEWRASLRTWLYRLARNASTRWRIHARRRAAGAVPLSEISEASLRVINRSPSFAESQAHAKLARLRATLDPDDQALLTLRLDRQMAWMDIAQILRPALGESASEEKISEEDLRRVAARLRKRFQLLKEELRARAKDADGDPKSS